MAHLMPLSPPSTYARQPYHNYPIAPLLSKGRQQPPGASHYPTMHRLVLGTRNEALGIDIPPSLLLQSSYPSYTMDTRFTSTQISAESSRVAWDKRTTYFKPCVAWGSKADIRIHYPHTRRQPGTVATFYVIRIKSQETPEINTRALLGHDLHKFQ